MKTGVRWIGLMLAMTIWTTAALASDAPARRVGEIIWIEGRVDVTAPGRPAAAARKGQAVRVGDILRTKSRSRAEVRFIDGSQMRMAETSRVEIDRYMVDDGRTDGLLHLFRGKIQTVVQKSKGFFGLSKANRFEVHTKNAVCGVRGTNYFSAYVNGTSDFIFKEGHGYGYNKNLPGQVAEVSAGQALQVRGAETPPQLRPASQAELDAHGSDTDADDDENGQEEGADSAAEENDETDAGEGGSDVAEEPAASGDADPASGESDGADSLSGGEAGGVESTGPDGCFTTGDGADLYTDGAVPGVEVFSDDIFTADGAYTEDAMDMLTDIFGPDSMLTDPVVPWEEEQINSGMTTSYAVAGSLDGGLQVRLYGTWNPDEWLPPISYVDLVAGDLDAAHQLRLSPGGFWFDGAVKGEIAGLWVGADGGAGLLMGDLDGTYAADGTWETGYLPLTSIEMTAAGVAAYNAAEPIPDPTPILYDYCAEVGRTFASGTGEIQLLNPDGELIGGWIGIPDQDWGVFRGVLTGTFTDGVADHWHVAINGATQTGGFDNIQWVEIEGSQWSGAEIHGTATGAWLDLENATTGVLGGAVDGVFDPADPKNIWDMVIGGTWLGTERFLDMIASSRNAEMDAMGVPRFEVGSTTLSGTDGNLDVQINNMTFFAGAAAQKPEIWASGNVTGQYADAPAIGTEVLLDGVGFSNVRFSVERWDGMGGKWGAEIVGAGQVSGHSVTVVGGAAGEVNAAASFIGTAAGVAGDGTAAVAQ